MLEFKRKDTEFEEFKAERSLLDSCKNTLETEKFYISTIGVGEDFLDIRPRDVQEKRSCIPVYGYRKNAIKKYRSRQTDKFEQDVYYSILGITDEVTRIVSSLIKEFFVPISNGSAWENICKLCGITDKKTLGRRHFWIDYCEPFSRIALEFDSNKHRLNYDKARDIYLYSFLGISTFRFQNYCGEGDEIKSNAVIQEKVKRSKDLGTIMSYLSKEIDDIKKRRPLFFDYPATNWFGTILKQCGISIDSGTVKKFLYGPELEAAIRSGYLPNYQKAFL